MLVLLGGCTTDKPASTATETNTLTGIQKVILPGEHKLSLKAGTYQLWIFHVWKSKNVNSSETGLPRIGLQAEQGIEPEIQVEKEPKNTSRDFYAGIDPDRRGVMWGLVRIKSTGTYRLSGKGAESYVAAVVPLDSLWHDPGSQIHFKDDNNDAGFVDSSVK